MKLLHLFHGEARNLRSVAYTSEIAAQEDRCCLSAATLKAWLDHSQDHAHRVVALGPSRVQNTLASLDIQLAAFGGAIQGTAELSASMLRRWLREFSQDIDALVCWSVGTLRMARHLRPSLPCVLCLPQPPSTADARLLARLMRKRGAVHVICFSPTAANILITEGVRNEGLFVVRPGVMPSLCTVCDRDALRESWGITDQETPLLMAVGNSTMRVNAERAALTMALATEAMGNPGTLRQDIRLLVHPGQQYRVLGHEIFRSVEMPQLMIQDGQANDLWQVLPGIDIALVFGRFGDRLARAWAMASGRAVVCGPGLGVEDDVRDGIDGLIAKSNEPRDLAHCLKELLVDRALRASLGERAAARALDWFSPTQMAQTLDQLVSDRVHSLTPTPPAV